MTIDPPLAPDEAVAAGGEREILETFLDLYRSIVARKAATLTDAQLRERHVPSATTLAGVVAHLAAVEREWFQLVLAGRSVDEIGGVPSGDGWTVDPGIDAATLVAGYERACAESRRIAAEQALDATVPHARLGRVSLRWIYVHMIEETARHAGHADILRERTDGATGFDG
jgi:uncharacterized damage-inducible protein DinB